jgi:hypothetical protein
VNEQLLQYMRQAVERVVEANGGQDQVRGTVNADGSIAWTGRTGASTNVHGFLPLAMIQALNAQARSVFAELSSASGSSVGTRTGQPEQTAGGLWRNARQQRAQQVSDDAAPEPPVIDRAQVLAQDIAGEGAERWKLHSGRWTWTSAATRAAENLHTLEGRREASRLREQYEREFRARAQEEGLNEQDVNQGREEGRQSPSLWQKAKAHMMGGGRHGAVVGGGLGLLMGIAVGALEGMIGDVLVFALSGLGASGQASARIGMSVLSVVTTGLKAVVGIGATMLGAVIGAILGPAIMAALGMIGGLIGGAVGALMGTVARAFGEALSGIKTIIDDLIGSALRYSQAMLDITVATGMGSRSASGLVNVLGMLGVKSEEVTRAFGNWSSHLELLAPRLGVLGVNLQRNAAGTVDWVGALAQLRQRWQELPELLRLPMFNAVLGSGRTQAILPALVAPEDQFNAAAQRSAEQEGAAGAGEAVFGRYRWIRDRLLSMVEIAKVRVGEALLPFAEGVLGKLESKLPELLEKAIVFATKLPEYLATGWNALVEFMKRIVEGVPSVVEMFMKLIEFGRDMVNVLAQVAEKIAGVFGVKVDLPVVPEVPWAKGGKPQGGSMGQHAYEGDAGDFGFMGADGGDEESPVSKGIGIGGNIVAGGILARILRGPIARLLGGLGPRIAAQLPRIVGSATAGVLGGPVGTILGIIAAIAGVIPLINIGADKLRESVGEPPLHPKRREAWEREHGQGRAEADAAREAALEPWRKGSQHLTDWLDKLKLDPTAMRNQQQAQAAQRHTVELKLPKPLYAEVGALEIGENLRVLFSSTAG